MRLEDKQTIVDQLHEKFAKNEIVILTDYKGLTVEAVSDLRRKLREAGVEYKVVKNTLLRRAAEGTDVAPMIDHFKGPSAVAISYEDPVAPAKVLTDFAKQNKKLEIQAGVMKGKMLDVDGIKALSLLPSREEMLSRLLATMQAVPQSFVRVLAEVPRSFVNVLNAIKEEKEAA